MLKFFSAAQLNHDNFIDQAFQASAVSTNLNPYQGLKLIEASATDATERFNQSESLSGIET